MLLTEPYIDKVLLADGCFAFSFNKHTEEPETYSFIERWNNKESLNKHMESNYFKKHMLEVQEYIISSPTIDIYQCY